MPDACKSAIETVMPINRLVQVGPSRKRYWKISAGCHGERHINPNPSAILIVDLLHKFTKNAFVGTAVTLYLSKRQSNGSKLIVLAPHDTAHCGQRKNKSPLSLAQVDYFEVVVYCIYET